MRVSFNVTKDELIWLETVICWGGEITDYLGDKALEFKGKKDWNAIQYRLYEKVRKGWKVN